MRPGVHGVKSAKNGSAFCVVVTSHDSVVLVGIKQWKRLFLVSTSEERANTMVVCVKKLNLAGRLVNKLRNERGWTQDELANRLQHAGWRVSRSGLSKIEGGLVYVHDYQVQIFAFVFRVPAVTFVPTLDLSKPIEETLSRFIDNEKLKLRQLFDAAASARRLKQNL